MPRNNNVIFESIRMLYPNFSGAPSKYNPQGNRTFSMLLDPDLADRLAQDGWNVKTSTPRTSGDPPIYHLPITVSFKYYPPKIVLIKSTGRTVLGEAELSILDYAQFTNVDVSINPYEYDFNGKHGIKAYLSSLYATIYEDELELKYNDVPISAIGAIKPNEV